MDFFKTIGGKLSNAGRAVARFFRNIGDIWRLNRTISEKRKQIARSCAALGENYYQLHRDDAEENLAPVVNDIKTLYRDMYDCEEQIKLIRGVVKCPNCGGDIPLNAAFCSACGAPAPAVRRPEAPAGMVECPGCHELVSKENNFCTKCGTKLGD